MIRLCQLCLSGQGQEVVVFRESDMKHASQSAFGRPIPVCPNPGNTTADGPDKWQLFDQLAEAAQAFDLSHRTLGVLKALLSFLPTREIPGGAGAIVFPSNATLSRRLSGMPESTLRRHLARLVQSGIVSRQDSPNGKRYARRLGRDVALAFGFDLAPLRRMASEINTRAQQARAEHESLRLLRDEVMILRARIIVRDGPTAQTDEAARLLRRKPDQGGLATMKDALLDTLDAVDKTTRMPEKMSGTVAQNERHLQSSDESVVDKEKPAAKTEHAATKAAEQLITVKDIRAQCPSVQAYFPDRLQTWRDVVETGDSLSPMLGIDTPVLGHARRVMGLEQASIAIFCILERIDTIRSPGAYLRHLCKLAEAGQFSLTSMLRKGAQPEIVS